MGTTSLSDKRMHGEGGPSEVVIIYLYQQEKITTDRGEKYHELSTKSGFECKLNCTTQDLPFRVNLPVVPHKAVAEISKIG